MRIAGIIGGIAPSSTIAYYQRIVDGVRTRTAEAAYPHVIINSINLRQMLPLFEAGDKAGAVSLLVGELHRLALAGADFALFASNTPHLYFADIAAASPLPLISIVEAVAAHAAQRGLRRLLLLGTGYTMRASFYRTALAASGTDVLVPSASDIAMIHALYMSELVPGRYASATRDAMLRVIRHAHEESRIDGVILGGTELPLLFAMAEYRGLPLLDSTQIHVDRVIAEIGVGTDAC